MDNVDNAKRKDLSRCDFRKQSNLAVGIFIVLKHGRNMKLNLESQTDQSRRRKGNVVITESHKCNGHLCDVHCNPLLYMLEKWNTEQENFKLHKPL